MFSSARLKIERANKHLRDLESSIQRLPDLNQVSIQPGPEGRGNRIQHEIPNYSDVKNEFAILAGDSIHNFRTALDHAWVASIKRIGLTPDRHTKFPFREKIQELEGVMKGVEIHIASPALFELILSKIKPYKAGNEFLWELHYLDIADKHELLLPVVSYASINDIRVENDAGRIVSGDTWGGYFEGVINVDLLTQKVHYHGDRAMSIRLDHGVFAKSLDVTDLLQLFSQVATKVVQLLEEVTDLGSGWPVNITIPDQADE